MNVVCPTTIRQSGASGQQPPVPRQTSNPAAWSASVAVLALIALGALPASAADGHHTVVPAEDVTWGSGPPTLPLGAQLAVLFGSPAKQGPFVIRLKFPADYEIAPHWHSKDELVTVISGGFGMGVGQTHNRETAPLLVPASFVHLPPHMPHYAWTAEETVVQINGIGPFDITYIDPKNDQRTN